MHFLQSWFKLRAAKPLTTVEGCKANLKKIISAFSLLQEKNAVFGSKFMSNGHCSVHSTWPSSNKGILKQPIKIEIQRNIFMPLQCLLLARMWLLDKIHCGKRTSPVWYWCSLKQVVNLQITLSSRSYIFHFMQLSRTGYLFWPQCVTVASHLFQEELHIESVLFYNKTLTLHYISYTQ